MTTTPPLSPHLDLTGLEEITGRELAARRAWLLEAISAAEPPAGGTVLATLALAAVTAQLAARAQTHAAHSDDRHACACGYECTGLTAIEDHLDTHDDDGTHYEQAPPASRPGRRSPGNAVRALPAREQVQR